jgi:hypothetical protein
VQKNIGSNGDQSLEIMITPKIRESMISKKLEFRIARDRLGYSV